MPFVPALLEEYAAEYLSGPMHSFCDEFMTRTYFVPEKCKRVAPAIVYVDGTVRPQVVSFRNNPSLHTIFSCYAKKTAIPILLNTSFNIHESPIVCTSADALSTFSRSGLDILAIGAFIVYGKN